MIMTGQLQFTAHASQRCYDRGLDKAMVQDLWDQGKFIPYRNENGIMHAVAFIVEKCEYYEIITKSTAVITIMPLIWREAAVPDCIKLKAYAVATQLPPPEVKPLEVKPPKVHVIIMAETCSLRLSYWPRGTTVDTVLADLRRTYSGKMVKISVGAGPLHQYQL